MKFITVLGMASFMLVMSFQPIWGQKADLAQIESELVGLAEDVLLHDSLSYKIKQNKVFARKLIDMLKRPESYNYPFDSLKTVSILRASDNAFRLFTWHIVDRNRSAYGGRQFHYYFGLVQRKYENPNGKTEYLVIPLLEIPRIAPELEHMVLDNDNWLGAQYYLPRYHKTIPQYTFKLKPPNTENAYVLAGRPSNSLVESKVNFYLLMGWNGADESTNYKVADVMYFDPEDPQKVLFGAQVFFYQKLIGSNKRMFIGKHRLLFKYSENAPFSLNMAYVKAGLFGRKEMLVFDHLAESTANSLQTNWEVGPDGSYDAVLFTKNNGGYFKWYSNVELAEKYNKKLSQEQKWIYSVYHNEKIQAKIDQKSQKEYSKRERQKLKEAGIDLGKKRKKP